MKIFNHKKTFDYLADQLVEKRYQLRVEHNHSTMKWYAYFAGKDQRGLFDDDDDWKTESDTPTEAIKKLQHQLDLDNFEMPMTNVIYKNRS